MPKRVPPGEKRLEMLVYRVNPREMAALKARAEAYGMPLGTFCREIALYGVMALSSSPSAPSRVEAKEEQASPEPPPTRPGPAVDVPAPGEWAGEVKPADPEKQEFLHRRVQELLDAGEDPTIAKSLARAEWRKRNGSQIAVS